MLSDVFHGKILEDRSFVVQGRLVDKTKTLYVAAALTSIEWRLVRKDTGAEVVPLTALTPIATYVIAPFDWDGSIEQANFRHVGAHTICTVGGITYQAQYTFTSNDGTVGGAVVEMETVDMVGV